MKTQIQVIALLIAVVGLCSCQSSSPRTPAAASTTDSPPWASGATVTKAEEIVVDIDGIDDIRIGGEKHTLSSLRAFFDSKRPSRVLVRSKGTTTAGLSVGIDSFLERYGFKQDLHLGNEQLWVTPASSR